MRQQPIIQLLADGRRLHMHDGPIDLIVEAFGEAGEVQKSYRAAAVRFETLLDELCGELTSLRSRMARVNPVPQGTTAQRMHSAVLPFAERVFITPMAAVAGAVAEEILDSMTREANLSRGYVNDGGDIAIHLSRGEQFSVGLMDYPDLGRRDSQPSLFGATKIEFADDSRGIATSGWRGRSFSLGIADAVTVLAPRAAMADAAATVIANAVDLPGHIGIVRVPAREIAPDTDLGNLLVTRAVPSLHRAQIAEALARGAQVADGLRREGLICAAALHLQGETQLVGETSQPRLFSRAQSVERNRSLAHA